MRQLLAALRTAAETKAALQGRIEEVERQNAALYQSITGRDAVIAERNEEIAKIKGATPGPIEVSDVTRDPESSRSSA